MSANGGPAGIVLASSMEPDAILLDVMMPEMDGPSTLRSLRLQPITHDTPVIFLTAKVREADRGHYLKLGVHGVLSKPFDPLTLGQQIKDLLSWS